MIARRGSEFGLHIPEAVGEQITTSIKLLGSEVYRDREDASKDLLQVGHLDGAAALPPGGSRELLLLAAPLGTFRDGGAATGWKDGARCASALSSPVRLWW